QWHAVAMVVDRTANRLSLYVDGIERAGGPPSPSGFGIMRNAGWPFGAAHAQGNSTPQEFPGVIDEIRVSNTAHSAAKVASDYFGLEAVQVTAIAPTIVQRGVSSVPFSFTGIGLVGATVSPNDASVSVNVTATSYTRVDFSLSLPNTVPLGQLS